MLEGLFYCLRTPAVGIVRRGRREFAAGGILSGFLVSEKTCHFVFLIKMTGKYTGDFSAVLSKFKKEVDYEVAS